MYFICNWRASKSFLLSHTQASFQTPQNRLASWQAKHSTLTMPLVLIVLVTCLILRFTVSSFIIIFWLLNLHLLSNTSSKPNAISPVPQYSWGVFKYKHALNELLLSVSCNSSLHKLKYLQVMPLPCELPDKIIVFQASPHQPPKRWAIKHNEIIVTLTLSFRVTCYTAKITRPHAHVNTYT